MGLYVAGSWGARRIVRVTWQQSGEWRLQRQVDVGASASSWILSPRSYVTSWLMVLRWHNEISPASVIILPGEMTTDDWRRWQARLKLEGGKLAVTTDA